MFGRWSMLFPNTFWVLTPGRGLPGVTVWFVLFGQICAAEGSTGGQNPACVHWWKGCSLYSSSVHVPIWAQGCCQLFICLKVLDGLAAILTWKVLNFNPPLYFIETGIVIMYFSFRSEGPNFINSNTVFIYIVQEPGLCLLYLCILHVLGIDQHIRQYVVHEWMSKWRNNSLIHSNGSKS